MFSSLVLAGLLLAVEPIYARQPGTCKEVRFSVSATASNVQTSVLPSDLLSTSLDDIISDLTGAAVNVVSGTQTLAGWYCEPTTRNANSSKLQVFRGSFFTNRESWTALGGTGLFNPPLSQYQPQMYSWFDYANNLGYPTLAIDSLGDGASSRPDGLVFAQINYDIALYHDLVMQIRSGSTGQLPRTYTHLFHIGNSLGSTLGNNMADAYPSDFDAYVLTGWSRLVQPSLPGVALNSPAPAVVVNATRFAGVPLDYLTSTIETSLTNSFFGDPTYVDFDPQIASLFFQRRDTVSVGYAATQYLPTSAPVASGYGGRVFVLTGEHDQAFCGLGSSALSPDTNCGGLLAASGSLFPAAEYNYLSVPRAGHALILHKSAQYSFRIAHEFLAGARFAG